MNRTLVYTSEFCGYCHAAIRLLTERCIEHTVIDITDDPAARAEMERRAEGRRTVPQIFIDGHPIGGFSELRALDSSGELRALLEASPGGDPT